MIRLFTFAVVLALAAALACSQSSPSAPGETPSEPASLSSPTPERPSGTQATGSPASPLCPDPQPPLVTDFGVRQAPDLPEPRARVPFRDPVFGTCLVRVTDRAADLSPDDTS